MAGPRRPDGGFRPAAPQAKRAESAANEEAAGGLVPPLTARGRIEFPPVQRDEERPDQQKQQNQDRLLGEGRIGDESVSSSELAEMGSLVAARHLMVLLAKNRGKKEREAVLAHVGELLIGLEKPELVRRLLLEMPDAGRIIDIYPLEVLNYVLRKRGDLLPGFEVGEIILNKDQLELTTFRVEEPIAIRLPLSLKMRAFALDGGGTPGYCFSPGAPGEYLLELGEAGHFTLLFRGDVRKTSFVDSVEIAVEDSEASEPSRR